MKFFKKKVEAEKVLKCRHCGEDVLLHDKILIEGFKLDDFCAVCYLTYLEALIFEELKHYTVIPSDRLAIFARTVINKNR